MWQTNLRERDKLRLYYVNDMVIIGNNDEMIKFTKNNEFEVWITYATKMRDCFKRNCRIHNS